MVNYTTSTLNKQGTLEKDAVTYGVNFTAVNSELTRLACSITKKVVKQYPDGNGGFVDNPEDINVGNITLEHGRKVIEIIQEEDVIQHIMVFQEILDEVIGKNTPTT